jgi:hypothetical protein
MTKELESPGRRRVRRLATCATAVGLGAGIITGTGVASADTATDPNGNPTDPPSNSTGVLGGVLTNLAKGTRNLSEIHVVKELNKASQNLLRIATNHSLTTARLV